MKDNAVQKRASLHESTVQAVARGEVAPAPKRQRKGSWEPKTTESWELTVHPMVMQTARGLLAGSYSTIEIVDETTVVVR